MNQPLNDYDDIFEHGDPCANCATKAMCKGEGDSDCPLPLFYAFWSIKKRVEKLERDAIKGNKESIKELANISKKLIKDWIDSYERGRKITKNLIR